MTEHVTAIPPRKIGIPPAAVGEAVAIDLAEALGAWLVARGKVGTAGLERALRLQSSGTDRFDQILAKLGLVSDRDIAEALASCMGLKLITPADYPVQPLFDEAISQKFLRHSHVLPVSETPEGVEIAMADPLDKAAAHAVELAIGRRVIPAVAVPVEIEAAMDRLYGTGRKGVSALEDDVVSQRGGREQDVERLRDLASEAPVIRLVNQLIAQAVEARASDIHIEPFERRAARPLPHRRRAARGRARRRGARSAAIVSRIKIMARLNIAERRLPQDGRIKLARARQGHRPPRLDRCRRCTARSVVLRILDRAGVVLDLDGARLRRRRR